MKTNHYDRQINQPTDRRTLGLINKGSDRSKEVEHPALLGKMTDHPTDRRTDRVIMDIYGLLLIYHYRECKQLSK